MTSTIALAVIASDPVTAEGAISCLRQYAGLTLLQAEERAEADVVLMLATEVTEETLLLMEAVAARSSNPGMSIVLVADSIREHQVARAVRCGLRSVLWRWETGFEKVLEAVRNIACGRAQLPPLVQNWLIDQVRTVHREVLGPRGITISGLEAREVEVLRLLADGLDSAEIAQELNYSERTIKNIVSGMMSRLGMRNRTQVVAHALRSGVL
ncbi:response regulator transcription factor [Streptomyces sp. NPDC058469]|uniref:response regulator transcription factor n=1 Tax=Streptomyces sp. NPDC058469 TaxID=3346514 RepID=UPI00365EE65D